MLQTAQHLDAANLALREVCKSLLAVAAEDPTIYAVIQRLAEVGQEIAAGKQAALLAAEAEEGMFVGAGI
jgi:hypothetical protein